MTGTGIAVTRRQVLGGLAGSAALVAAVGCGAPKASEGGTGPSTAPAKLLWQTKSPDTYKKLAAWAIDEYRKTHPNVTIDTMGDDGNVEKTVTAMVAGLGPDVILSWGYNYWQLAAKGQLYNHNELIKDWKKADVDDFIDFQWKGFVIPGTNFRFAMPMYINSMVIYYNKSLFQKRGQKEPNADWTLDEYATMLKQMTFQDGDKKVWGGYMPATAFDRFQNHVLMYGGHVVDPKDLTKTQLDQQPAQQGLEWMRARLWQDQTLAPIDSAKRTWTPNGPEDGFEQGAVATEEAALGSVFLRMAKNAANVNWDLTHIPKGPVRRAALGTTDGWGLWKGTKAKDQAWDLIKFITTNRFYDEQARAEARLPSRKSALDSWAKIVRETYPYTNNVNLKVIIEQMTTNQYNSVDEIFLCQTEVQPVVQSALDQVFKAGTAPVTLFRDMKGQIEEAAGRCGIDPNKVFK